MNRNELLKERESLISKEDLLTNSLIDITERINLIDAQLYPPEAYAEMRHTVLDEIELECSRYDLWSGIEHEEYVDRVRSELRDMPHPNSQEVYGRIIVAASILVEWACWMRSRFELYTHNQNEAAQ